MGCFSWIFSDKNEPLFIGDRGFVPLPIDKGAFNLKAGTVLEEPDYDGYGMFQGYDVYDLVAIWNREFLAKNPDFVIPSCNRKISQYRWYFIYADLSISEKEIANRYKAATKVNNSSFELRDIGIAIACLDEDKAVIPYPIKICKYRENADYEQLEASKDDPYQGL